MALPELKPKFIRRIYLSGAMRGFPRNNFPAFDHAARLLRYDGYEVFSPADNDRIICGWAPDYIPTEDDFTKAMRLRRAFSTPLLRRRLPRNMHLG